VLLVGDGPYPPAEVAEALGDPPLAKLPADRAGASMLAGHPGSARALRRSPLLRASGQAATTLLATVGQAPQHADPDPDPTAVTAAPASPVGSALVGSP
jgi:hypothetical protein